MKKLAPAAVTLALFVAAFLVRTWGISDHFWMLEDQRRDWEIALGPFRSLPLVGPPTHVHGYTLGPAFYWILWAIRVTVGPFFDNLPHAGGIGEAFLETAADTLLMLAVWRRTKSPWIALTAFVLIASAPFDLSLAALVWNPTMGATLVKCALAMILFGWHRRSLLLTGLTAAIAWAAVHAYTGAIFSAVATLSLLIFSTDWRAMARRALVVGGVVALLQVPYVIYQMKVSNAPAMAAVSGGVAQILRGEAKPELFNSARGYVESAGAFQQLRDWRYSALILALASLLLIVRFRRDPELLWILLVPQLAAIAGFALFLGALDTYYYLPLLACSTLTVVLAFLPRDGKAATIAGVVALIAALALVPARIAGSKEFQMPEYKVLVSASRVLRDRHEPLRAVRVSFELPPSVNPGFPYFAMGGLSDPKSTLVATINRDGSITYNR